MPVNPIDGFGLFEDHTPFLGQSFYGPRLTAMKAGGFSVVMNYDLLSAHMTDVVAYINYAASIGMKVAVNLGDAAIWKTATYSTKYPQMYADAGNPGTGIAFMQYVIAQTKTLAGVWGWYIGDELLNTDHTTFKTYADAVKAADSTYPRMIIQAANGTSSVGQGACIYQDCCEVLGDDYYDIGQSQPLTTVAEAAGIEAFCNNHAVQSAIVLQAHSLANYGIPTGTWPTEAQMQQHRNDALNNMTPRLLLWFSYYSVTEAGSTVNPPASQWTNLVNATNDRTGYALFPTLKRRGSLLDYNSLVLGSQGDTPPQAFYRCADAGISLLTDSSGHGNGALANTSGVTFGQTGLMPALDTDTSILLDGTSGYIKLPASINGSGRSAMSFEIWFKLSTASLASFSQVVMGDNINNPTHNSYEMYWSGTSQLLFFVGNGTTAASASIAATASTATLYHVVGTYDGAHVQIYLNGVAGASNALTGTIGSTANLPVLGAALTHTTPLPAYIAKVAMYNYALSPTQVAKHYSTGIGLVTGNTMLFPTMKRRQS